ncbi:MAG: ECF transporter S component [Ruminococcus sp.]|nr:ECF transporter S component [Ruminococcus sp.]
MNVKTLVLIALFAAIASVISMFKILSFKIVPSVYFLQYDPKDIIIGLSGIMFGPFAVVATSLISSTVEFLTSSTTGFIGFVMDALSSIAFGLLPAFLCLKKKGLFRLITAFILGVASMTIVMTAFDIIIAVPLFFDMARKLSWDTFGTGLIIFNLIKGALNATFVILLFKVMSRFTKQIKSGL